MNNTQIIEKGLKQSLNIIGGSVIRALTMTSDELVDGTDVPRWTYNLQDSIGCGVYTTGGTLLNYTIPAKQATEPRSGADDFPMEQRYQKHSERPIWDVDGIDEEDAYWGQEQLFDMLKSPPPAVASNKGWALAYIAAMPYSQIIDAQYDILEEQMVSPIFLKNIRK